MDNANKLCPKCQTEIPKKAVRCPNCQWDLRSWYKKHPLFTFILVSIFLAWFFQALNEPSPQEKVEIKKQQEIENTQKAEQNKKNKEILSKVEILDKKIVDRYGFAHLSVKVKNNTWKDIDGLELKSSFKNNFWENVFANISRDKYFYWISQELLKNQKNTTFEWQLSLFDHATTIDEFEIYKIHFTSWETINID